MDPTIINIMFLDPKPYINNLCSFNDNIKNNDMFSTVYDGDKAKKGYTCEFLDLHSINNIYIYSNIGNYNSIAPNGSIANISKKICLTSDFAYLLVDNTAPIHDGLSCSNKTLSYLGFKICNTAGIEIPLHKQNISFIVVFFKALET